MMKKKGKKGKKAKTKSGKDGKSDGKGEKESELERARANAALWETRLGITENSRLEYREAAHRLARANEELTCQQYRAEKETVDIIAFLKKKESEKEARISELEDELQQQKTKAAEEKDQIVKEYTDVINEMEEKFKKRLSEFRMIQGELKTIKEFRKTKIAMEQELTNIRENMTIQEREHQQMLSRMEHKFFTEKVRLEKEAEQRIAQLAERAHNEAVVQLDEASCSVFKENVRLNQALGYHIQEVAHLRERGETLEEENSELLLHKDTNQLMIQHNIGRISTQKKELFDLRSKVKVLERALQVMTSQFEREKIAMEQRTLVTSQSNLSELEKAQKLVGHQERELARHKRLSQTLLQQRTELELFFHGALEQVKKEILANRLLYRQEALEAYKRRMSEARLGKEEYPRIRTFSRKPNSTNSVFADLEEAEKWTNMPSEKVDISQLTWEQKEKVLRLLFSRMNSQKHSKIHSKKSALSLTASSEQEPQSRGSGVTEEFVQHTFITQAPVPNLTATQPEVPTA
ncbi:basal body-orientation factor 1-like [Engraulis encrasicolus]|uniref:basal body-orientation factor 1-like n=1 Tax=Engraulis encrasicolus TaxID=184585 RepID=UPI002FD50DBF